MRTSTQVASQYKLETVSRACEILRVLSDAQQALSLGDVVERTGLERTIVFRVLRTLEDEGLLRRPEGRRYVSNVNIVTQKRFRIGYASQSGDSFSKAVTQGIRWAAVRDQIDLIEVENLYNAKAALRNAQKLAEQKVDLAIEFQVYERIGTQLSSIYERASIPVIAVEIPQPGATFFGIDNYSVGQLAGKSLVKAAQQHWQGEIDELLMLDLEIAGSLPHLRISGAETAVRKALTGNYQIHRTGTSPHAILAEAQDAYFWGERSSGTGCAACVCGSGSKRSVLGVGGGGVPGSANGIAFSANENDRLHCNVSRTLWRQPDSNCARSSPPQTCAAGDLRADPIDHSAEHR